MRHRYRCYVYCNHLCNCFRRSDQGSVLEYEYRRTQWIVLWPNRALLISLGKRISLCLSHIETIRSRRPSRLNWSYYIRASPIPIRLFFLDTEWVYVRGFPLQTSRGIPEMQTRPGHLIQSKKDSRTVASSAFGGSIWRSVNAWWVLDNRPHPRNDGRSIHNHSSWVHVSICRRWFLTWMKKLYFTYVNFTAQFCVDIVWRKAQKIIAKHALLLVSLVAYDYRDSTWLSLTAITITICSLPDEWNIPICW